MRRRRSYRMHGLGKLPANCEIHVFRNPKTGEPLTGEGSRRKVCRKRKATAAQRNKWKKNLEAACLKEGGIPGNLTAACAKLGIELSPVEETPKKKKKAKA